MIRIGDAFRAGFARVTSTLASVRDRLVGASARGTMAVITPSPNARGGGGTNATVLRHLAARHPPLLQGLGRAALNGAREGFSLERSTWGSIARDAVQGAQVEIAARLRSGFYVTNTTATVARKLRAGHGSTPGVDTEQLADSLDNATASVE